MEYAKDLQTFMKDNKRMSQCRDLLHIKHLDLPQDIIDHIQFIYKYDAIQEKANEHYRYQVLRELRCKMYYSKYMYKYYVSLREIEGAFPPHKVFYSDPDQQLCL